MLSRHVNWKLTLVTYGPMLSAPVVVKLVHTCPGYPERLSQSKLWCRKTTYLGFLVLWSEQSQYIVYMYPFVVNCGQVLKRDKIYRRSPAYLVCPGYPLNVLTLHRLSLTEEIPKGWFLSQNWARTDCPSASHNWHIGQKDSPSYLILTLVYGDLSISPCWHSIDSVSLEGN